MEIKAPLVTRFRLRIRLANSALLPAFPASELRGLFNQGLSMAGVPETPEGTPGRYLFVPQWPGPQAKPDAPVARPAGYEFLAVCVAFGPTSAALQQLLAGFEALGTHCWLGHGSRKTSFAVAIEAVEGPSPNGSDPFAASALWSSGNATSPWAARVAWLAQHPRLQLTTLTPVALRRGRDIAAALDDTTALCQSLEDRLRRLSAAFGADPRQPPLAVPAADTLRDYVWQGSSVAFGRQGRGHSFMPMQGAVGALVLATPPSATLAALVAGEQCLVGRWTAFGLGQYRLDPAPAEDLEKIS